MKKLESLVRGFLQIGKNLILQSATERKNSGFLATGPNLTESGFIAVVIC
jgi:hypothetical protein